MRLFLELVDYVEWENSLKVLETLILKAVDALFIISLVPDSWVQLICL